MKLFSLAVQFVVTAYAAYLFWFLAFEYYPADPLGFTPPFVLWVIDTINLFIHEAGHLIFRLFGQTVSILGGSLMQCLIPLALAIVTWREKPHQAALPLFWLGENLVNASVYIADASYRNLKLIKDGLIHDWHWLLSDHLDWAEPIGLVVRGLGLAVCVVAIGLMAWYMIRDLRKVGVH